MVACLLRVCVLVCCVCVCVVHLMSRLIERFRKRTPTGGAGMGGVVVVGGGPKGWPKKYEHKETKGTQIYNKKNQF